MEKIKLLNGKTYELATNGIVKSDAECKLIFIADGSTFEEVESVFSSPDNTNKIYVLASGSDDIISSIIGYTEYTGLEKRYNYVVSTDMVNVGTEEDPQYETQDTTAVVMIVTLSKPSVETRIETVEEDTQTLAKAALFSAFSFTDAQAVEVKSLYPKWADLPNGTTLTKQEEATAGTEITKVLGTDGLLYKVAQTHNKQADWIPGQATASLFIVIDEEHSGTQEDPIPYNVNMIVYEDKIYEYAGILYRCTRDSGIALQYTPDQLIGQYFELVSDQE